MKYLWRALVAMGIGGVVGACSVAEERDEPTPLLRATLLATGDARLANVLRPRAFEEGWQRASGPGWTSPGWRGADEKRWSELGAKLPALADDALQIGVSRFRSTTVHLHPRGAAPVEGVLEAGHVVYPGAYRGADLVVTVGRHSLEQLFVLRDAAASFTFEWDVSLPRGLSARGVTESSVSLVFVDAAGGTVMTVAAPYAVDANGHKRGASLVWSETERRLTLELDARGLSFPVLLDPVFETGVWTKLAPAAAPSPRLSHSLEYDAVREKVILFGGTSGITGPVLADTWSWNGTTWSPLSPAKSPSARQKHAMAFDAARGKMVLFGGSNPTLLQDTWTWDGTTWTNVSAVPAKSPASREDHAMAYDAARGKVVMFGGGSETVPLMVNDTWLWDGVAWTRVVTAPGATPPARGIHALVYDEARSNVVLFGGTSNGKVMFNDTWTFDGAKWTQLFPANSPEPRYTVGATYDAERKQVLIFGGITPYGRFNDIWAWDGKNWTLLPTSAGPSPRAGTAMVFDPARRKTLLFGGLTNLSQTRLDDTWVFYTRGGACSTGADCGSGNCVDSVCCEVAACGTCEECDGATPGLCSPVTNSSDPGTCSGTTTCDSVGTCRVVTGQSCAGNADCASTFCVDNVCCSASSCGECGSCSAALKESGEDGTCGPTRSGIDPHADCAEESVTSCGRDGLCNGVGGCRLFTKGSSCGTSACLEGRATGQLCDGLGVCANTATGVDCAPYICDATFGACASACTRDDQCIVSHFCDLAINRCVLAPAKCDGDYTLTSSTGEKSDCRPYRCDHGGCRTECRGVQDCIFPATCDQTGHCVSTPPRNDDSGGCSVAGSTPLGSDSGPHSRGGVPLSLLAGISLALAIRRRAASASAASAKSRGQPGTLVGARAAPTEQPPLSPTGAAGTTMHRPSLPHAAGNTQS